MDRAVGPHSAPTRQRCTPRFQVGDATATVLLAAAGFEILSEVDSSDAGLAWFRQMRARIERDGPPPVTFAAFLGGSFGQMVANQVANLAERRIRTVMFVCARPL